MREQWRSWRDIAAHFRKLGRSQATPESCASAYHYRSHRYQSRSAA